MNRYKNNFINWDVCNEVLHYDFYKERLGPNATLDFFETAQKLDPLAKLFMNDFYVVESCDDMNSTVDAYILRMKELEQAGMLMDGIGIEGHFGVPNLPLMRAVLDKLATLQLPIWLSEARYLEAVLRKGFSHPSVNGIVVWAAIHPYGCYEMCMLNLPTGNVMDNLLKEWQTGTVNGQTDEHGSFSFDGFLGEYKVTVNYLDRTTNLTFSLRSGSETKHVNIHL
ncbi:metalloprotease [Lithospermum erythrorhizon]|uniref:Metalloprotease n=1 Tax=Lithospermum erythrorhizon TaxID=34254 RepID=A0AAV3NRL9_LITER